MSLSYGFSSQAAADSPQSLRDVRRGGGLGRWGRLGAIASTTILGQYTIHQLWVALINTQAIDTRASISVTALLIAMVGLTGMFFLWAQIYAGAEPGRPGRGDRPAAMGAETQAILQALAQEQEKSEQLLLNILPATIAKELKQKPRPIAHGYDQVTVMFADIVGFTPLSAQMSPRKLVHLLNLIFSTFDPLVEQYQLEKIKTIGDAYMVAGGLPQTHPHHADAMVALALAMQRAIAQISQDTGEDLRLRIGIHTGPVVAGVIGLKKFSYDLWGDTVNIASRMESQGIAGGIQLSEQTYRLLRQDYGLQSLGTIAIRGKGNMHTYGVLGLG